MPLHMPLMDPQDNDPQNNPATEGGHERTEIPQAGLSAPFDKPDPSDMREFGINSIKAGLHMQREVFDALEDIGRGWLARATSEAELAFNLPARLTATLSIPDALSAYQEWLSEWMNMCGEDTRRLLANSGKVINAGACCFIGASPAVTR